MVKIWKKIEEWDFYSVFLHEIGHILGFRHEHVFLNEAQRSAFGPNESSTGLSLLQLEVVDTQSIMNYGYLHQFKIVPNEKKRAQLSETDKVQARSYYSKK